MAGRLFQRGFLALVATQFFGAANDNLLKGVLTFGVAAAGVWSGILGAGGQAYVALCLTIPFILFSGYGGQIADRISKQKMTVVIKVVEIGVALIALIAFWAGSVWVGLLAMIALATQSAFFGPAKYGMIPELVDDGDLSRANGSINMFTNIAMICGMVLAGPVYEVFAPPKLDVEMVELWEVEADAPGQAFITALGREIAVDVPGPGAGRLDEDGEVDAYFFAATEGTTLEAEATYVPGDALEWRCIDEEGSTVWQSPLELASPIPVTIPSSGTYRVTVQAARPGGVGEFAFVVRVIDSPELAWVPGVAMIGIAILGLAACLFLPRLHGMQPDLTFDWSPFGTYWRSVVEMARSPLLMVALAWSFFYLVGMMAVLILPDYPDILGITVTEASVLLGVLGVAIGLGSVTAGIISGRHIEPRLIPIGAAGMTVMFVLLGLAPKDFWITALFLFVAGTFAGFYIVPLQALLQHLSPEGERGRFLGTANAMSFVCSSVGSLIFLFSRRALGLEANRIFLICAALSIVGTGVLIWRMRRLLGDESIRKPEPGTDEGQPD